MNTKIWKNFGSKTCIVLVFGCLITGCGFGCIANRGARVQAQPSVAVWTNFKTDKELSPVEIGQVLELAKEVGIDKPDEIGTFVYLPAGGTGIYVRGDEKVDGRNIHFDRVTIQKVGWVNSTPGDNRKWVGDFWCDEDKYSTYQRIYDFRQESIRVTLGDGVDVGMADAAIAQIAANKIRFTDEVKERYELLIGSAKPTGIYLNNFGSNYVMRFDAPRDWRLLFKFENGEVVPVNVFRETN
jgi:hypothetical protein